MSLLAGPDSIRPGDLAEAERALDALFLRQLLQASGAFQTKEGAPAIFADLIVDALASALVEADAQGADRLSILPKTEGAPTAGPHALAGSDPLARRPVSAGSALPAPKQGSDSRFTSLEQLVIGPSALTSGYGKRVDPFAGDHRHHRGVDLGAPEGSTIVAAAAGVIRSAGSRGAYGQAVEIDHGQGVTTLYAHASDLLVAPGDRVRRGQPIAKVGQTGRATGPHLHFEFRVKERPVDPSRALKLYRERAEGRGAEEDPRGPRP